ncbi:MAG: hypothetical protein CMF50_05580 [Legionellales bacterium]|nr:hypothetical protein [Legionellales bacterium]|tara:strand:- start:27484 stop:28491 length:1008 start_codon:yes stop_codon:yes gene_type:complete
MTYIVHIKPGNHVLFVNEDETVLEAALRQDFIFPYSCQSAACGTCCGKVLEGEVDYPFTEPMALMDDEIDAGYALFCVATPKSDLVIQNNDVIGPEQLPLKNLSYRVKSHSQLSETILQVVLEPPEDEAIVYRAGQYVTVSNSQGEARPFSIANAPVGGKHIELHIKLLENSQYLTILLDDIKEQQVVQLNGPFGRAIFHNAPPHPVILMAGGTGFTHSKAIIEHIHATGFDKPVHLYWGVSQLADLYFNNTLLNWAETRDNFSYTPVILDNTDSNWAGKTGFVHEAVLADYTDLRNHHVYASGPTEMVFTALREFEARGLRREFMFSDGFEEQA